VRSDCTVCGLPCGSTVRAFRPIEAGVDGEFALWFGKDIAVVRRLIRILAFGLGLLLLAVGALALGSAYLGDDEVVLQARALVENTLLAAGSGQFEFLPGDLVYRMDPFLSHVLVLYGFAPFGLVLAVTMLLPGKREAATAESDEPAAEVRATAYVDPKDQKKAGKAAASMAKSGRPLEAAEHCFGVGLFDEAAKYFIAGEDFEHAAEIRHDQNRFIESAELYLQGGLYESAASIFSQQDEWRRAAEAYEEAGDLSVAAEMYEKAKDFRNAARAYSVSGFARHAAKAFVKCEQWQQAAESLEEVIRDESISVGGDVRKAADLRKLVSMAGSLFERAQLDERAQSVYQRGGCFAEAAEIALRRGENEESAELFLKAKNVPRAAEQLRQVGRVEEAARHLAEHHRDRGEEELAAEHFIEAGDLLAAADLYRLLEQYLKAAEVYERFGDSAQAAEMYTVAGERTLAAESYERAGLYAEAAENFALLGDAERESAMLLKAGEFLRAGEIEIAGGRIDEAIAALQQVIPEHAEFVAASALLGEIFRERGMIPLAVQKLTQATEAQEISRNNVKAFYALARCYESSEEMGQATELYEKILAFDFNYEDVTGRLEGTRKQAATAMAATAEPQLGASGREGRYKILGTLGRGGMGVVYKAQDTVLDRLVAFKVLPDSLQENPQALKNFLREAKSAASLNHPNIVTVYDAGEQDGNYYIAMEYVDGNTLKEIVKHRGKISAGGIVHVLAQMSEALAYAHDNKIVHRDIKTANTMWARDRKAKIMDFGLAKVIEEVRNHTTVVSGTPYYMSPEQTLGKNVDHRTDIYSLGVSVFELATGRLPFIEGNLPYHHVHTQPPDPREIEASVPELLVDIILRCLKKDPSERFQSAREILAQLKSSLAG
jgi:tetratricopeptide (TPR) repeat protein